MDPRLASLNRDARMFLSRALNRSFAPPDWLTVNLTLRCNLSCTMCTTCYDVPDELSTQEVKDLIDQAASWGVKVFNPLGGELFMRGDLEEILEHACRKDFYITITTNGTLINRRRAEMIARIPPSKLHFNLSLDGPEAVHDSIRGEGMYRRALLGYQNLRDADAAAGNPVRKVLANTIVHRRNLVGLGDFLDGLDRLGFQGVQLLNLFRHGDDYPKEARDLWIQDRDLDTLDATVAQLVRRVQSQGRAGFRVLNTVDDLQLIRSYYTQDLSPLQAPCWAGWKELYINSDGAAIMCDGQLDFLAGTFGSVREQTLRQLWDSPALRERRQVVKECSTPCIQNCYLRRSSDSMDSIGRATLSILADQARQKLKSLRPRRGERVVDGVLTLELSDVAPWVAPWDGATERRWDSLVRDSPHPISEIWDEPARWSAWRDRGYVDFGRGFMGFELVDATLRDLQSERLVFPTVDLSWRGEPLAHPEIERVLRAVLTAIRDHGTFEQLRVRTDGRLLHAGVVDVVAEFPEIPQLWIVHGNGAGVVEDQVVRNVTALANARGPATRVVASWVVDEELDPFYFVDLWTPVLRDPAVVVGRLPAAGDALWFRRTDHDHFQQTAAARARLQELAEVLDVPCEPGLEDLPRRCKAAAATPTVSWDGKVVLCRWDTQLTNRVGEITSDPMSAIWADPVLQGHRRTAKGKGVPGLPKCTDCHYPYSPNAD